MLGGAQQPHGPANRSIVGLLTTGDHPPLTTLCPMATSEPGTAQAAAVAWLQAVLDRGDLLAAWAACDPVLRLVLAQDWVWTNRHHPAIGHERDWDEIAQGLAANPPESELWRRFATDLVGTWQQTWKGFDTRRWQVAPAPEVVDLDVEMVSFTERPTGFTRRFAMRHTGAGWVMASVDGDLRYEPGWPPRLAQP